MRLLTSSLAVIAITIGSVPAWCCCVGAANLDAAGNAEPLPAKSAPRSCCHPESPTPNRTPTPGPLNKSCECRVDLGLTDAADRSVFFSNGWEQTLAKLLASNEAAGPCPVCSDGSCSTSDGPPGSGGLVALVALQRFLL